MGPIPRNLLKQIQTDERYTPPAGARWSGPAFALKGDLRGRSTGRIGAVHILLSGLFVRDEEIGRGRASGGWSQSPLDADLLTANSVQPRGRRLMAWYERPKLVQGPIRLPAHVAGEMRLRDSA